MITIWFAVITILLIFMLCRIGFVINKCYKGKMSPPSSAKGAVCFTFFVYIVALVLGGLVISAFTGWVPDVEGGRKDFSNSIYSLNHGTTIPEPFTIGNVWVNGSEFYLVNEKSSNEAFRRWQPYTNTCEIKETDGEPRVTWQSVTYQTSNWISFWPKCYSKKDTIYTLHVPKGTIFRRIDTK